MKKYNSKKTADLLALELLGVKFVKLLKRGECVAKKSKKGATHKLSGTKLSSLIEPLKRWPKPPKNIVLPAPIGAQPDEPERPTDHDWHPPIPIGATWLEYSTSVGSIMAPIDTIGDYRGFRGKLRFGKLRYNEDFVSMMPGEEGNVTFWSDGRTSFAEGKDPAALKAKEAKAVAIQERKDAGLPPAVAEAFAARTAARKVPPGPRAGDVAGKVQNGVRKPGAGGKTARVWEICDTLHTKHKRTPTKDEVFAIAVAKEKASPGMTGTQLSYWRRFYGHNK